MKITTTGITVLAAIALQHQCSGQMTSPKAGEVYTTPTNIPIILASDCQINMIRVYNYHEYDFGGEILNYYQSETVASPNSTNVYTFDPSAAPWYLKCGDYVIKAVYTTNNGATYELAESGRIRIMTDRPTFDIRYPSTFSIVTRGQTVTFRWDILAKPGMEGAELCLTTPLLESCATEPALTITGGDLIRSNSFTWTVPLSTSIGEGQTPFPDGRYDVHLSSDRGIIQTSASFIIDSEATKAPTMKYELFPGTLYVTVGSGQRWGRAWWIETSNNLVDWTQTSRLQGQNWPTYEGLSQNFAIRNRGEQVFFRARVVP